ncbi:hypothetical protein SASPL_102271 [Salvia splendens]|uniref:Laccase n=1 Tax=Salvia splendens TaxID=180675 RepID=A0A8X9ABZ9_SALSN|nr:hypothetical protein SASPL_102271 [Salvia splendens]
MNRLCKDQVITAVNGGLPGPAIVARDGDTLVVLVNNISPYNVTIHWYPFPAPFRGIPVVIGEWWNALTINGQPGDLYPCSSKNTVRFTLVRGKTYLLRVINAALNTPVFFKIANHTFTVVAVDASWAVSSHVVPPLASFVNTSTTAIMSYTGASPLSPPLMPPALDPGPIRDRRAHVCDGGARPSPGPLRHSNRGLQRLCEQRERDLYTANFPDNQPVTFDYTNPSNEQNPALMGSARGTRVKVFKYNATVEMVLQNTAVLSSDDHPMHLHGLNFYVVAQGFGNYNPQTDSASFNLVNPQERNTVVVPAFVIRFRANNPGKY